MSRFNTVAQIRAPRSKFHMPQNVKMSASVGTLYPVYVQEIYPGDTFNCKTSFVARLSSSYIRPVMDNLFVDFYYFFVPARLCYSKFAEIFGENNNGAWAQQEPVVAPTTTDRTTVTSKTVADYLGLPLVEFLKVLILCLLEHLPRYMTIGSETKTLLTLCLSITMNIVKMKSLTMNLGHLIIILDSSPRLQSFMMYLHLHCLIHKKSCACLCSSCWLCTSDCKSQQ